ncbi:MAG TPA: 2-phospho-L-lactate transferase CofD family protein, partial [Patescibacteria group bacterium]|nr:2-phospho-L-lactate transferase CofD family protein [Patescibacteria group bacterium]
MTLNSQTHNFAASTHVKEIEKYAGRKVDYIVVNSQPIKPEIVRAYKREQEYPVADDLNKDSRVIRRPLLSSSVFQKPKSDNLKRSLLRHDSGKLAKAIIKLI